MQQVKNLRYTEGKYSLAGAFTLIELLVVISIIGILAALIFPVIGAVNRTKYRHRAASELSEIQFAINRYKATTGHYPPDNPGNWLTNQLYYELLGTTNTGTAYLTLDGSSQVLISSLSAAFGPNVTGFVNCTQPNKSDETASATPFLTGLKPYQYETVPAGERILICSVPWTGVQGLPNPYYPPFGYNSSSPTNNPNTYDLWVDVLIGGKTNRFSNWSSQPIIVH